MRVSADVYNDYLYQPAYRELSVFLKNFTDLLTITKNGWTHNAYDQVPKALVKGSTYFDEVALKTQSFDNKQSTLTALKLGLNQKSGAILNVSQGLKLNPSMTVTGNESGYQANHVPVLFAQLPHATNKFTVISGFSGDYDFRTNIFAGQIQFIDVRDLWND